MRTTLNKIRAHHPCKDGWEKLLRHLNKTQPDDDPLPLEEILNSNGLDDALWCLRAVEGHDREIRLYAVWCARQVQHLMCDRRSVAAVDVAERYARGRASSGELAAARAAAWEAEREAAREAREAAAWAAMAAARAAREAAWAAWESATWAARAAAAWAACEAGTAKAAQADELRRICEEIEAGRDPYPMEAKP